MMMEAATDMLEKAFVYDKVVHRHDYTQVSANSEARVIMGPDRSKRTLMCLPGSVRVSVVENVCVCVCVCRPTGKIHFSSKSRTSCSS